MDVKLAGGMCVESQACPSPRCRCTEFCSPADAHVGTSVFTHAYICVHTCMYTHMHALASLLLRSVSRLVPRQ